MGVAESTNVKNVLVIGETGVGKSCVINLILGKDDAQVSSSTVGCTFNIDKYTFENYCLFDTVGYNDNSEQDSKESLNKLAKLVKGTMEEGIALIVYIMKKGKVNKASKINYDFFVKEFCQDAVPVLLVVTHCEEDSVKTNWYIGQQKNFESLAMNFAGTVCGCAMKLPNPETDPDLVEFYQKKKSRTQKEVLEMIKQFVLKKPWKPSNWIPWVAGIFAGTLVFGLTTAAVIAFLPEVAIAFGAVTVASIKNVLLKK